MDPTKSGLQVGRYLWVCFLLHVKVNTSNGIMHPTSGLMKILHFDCYATRGLLVTVIEWRNSWVFLSFFFPQINIC